MTKRPDTSRRPRVLIPLPDCDFDTTEVVVPWQHLRAAEVDVVFATASASAGRTDPLLLTGVVFGRLGARASVIEAYRELEAEPGYRKPLSYDQIDPASFDGLVLPGGHAPGMRPYLEDVTLRERVLALWQSGVPVGAICHGTVVLARTADPATGHSVLAGHRLTALTKPMERAFMLATSWRRGRGYGRTYPVYVEDEVRDGIGEQGTFLRGGSRHQPFVVADRHLVTARWPGDAGVFAQTLTRRVLAHTGGG